MAGKEVGQVSRWKRLLQSAMSVILAAVICSVVISIPPNPGQALRVNLFFERAVTTTYFTLMFAGPGWVLSLPLVLFVSDLRAWRFWALLALGAGIGPLLLLSFSLYTYLTSPRSTSFPEAEGFVFLSMAVSGVTTLIYLHILRHSQRMQLRGVASSEVGVLEGKDDTILG